MDGTFNIYVKDLEANCKAKELGMKPTFTLKS